MRFAKIGWLIFGVVAACALAPAARAQSAVKIGYVDLQRALNESDTGRRAKEDFKGQVDKLQGKLKKQKEDLEGLKSQLEKKASVMKDEERGDLEENYRKKLRDFERDYKDAQADLQRKDNELTATIIKDLQEIIRDYGEREGYTIILEASSNAVLYGAKGADLTDMVIELYNGSGKKRGK